MFTSIDTFLIEKLDSFMAYCQKRRGLDLAVTMLWSSHAVVLTMLAAGYVLGVGMFIFNGVLAVIGLYFAYDTFKKNNGYQYDARKCLTANANSLLWRETPGSRFFGWVMVIICIPFVIVGDKSGLFVSAQIIAALIDYYIKCCRFLGPGEHAKETKQVVSSNLASESAS